MAAVAHRTAAPHAAAARSIVAARTTRPAVAQNQVNRNAVARVNPTRVVNNNSGAAWGYGNGGYGNGGYGYGNRGYGGYGYGSPYLNLYLGGLGYGNNGYGYGYGNGGYGYGNTGYGYGNNATITGYQLVNIPGLGWVLVPIQLPSSYAMYGYPTGF